MAFLYAFYGVLKRQYQDIKLRVAGGIERLTKTLIDDIKRIETIDKSGMLTYCVTAPDHYRKALDIAQKMEINYSKPEKIIIAGMGGSAIGGDLVKDWVRNQLKVPIEVNREYYLPQYADQKTLVLIISYSGDTEESLSAFLDALNKKCMIYCISSGGALLKYAKKHNVPYSVVPGGMPPRAALPYLLVPMLVFLEKSGLVLGVKEGLEETLKILDKICKENGPDNLLCENFAKNLAHNIGDSTPTVYGFDYFRSVALRFKQQFNENSKSPAKSEVFPEIDHNEIVGWETRGELTRWFSLIFIRDRNEANEIRSRIENTKNIVEQAGLMTFEIEAEGQSRLAKMISTVVIGDFVSVYLAILREVDPTPVRNIDYLKETLKQNGVKNRIIKELEGI